ncbi:MAG: glutamate mutase L [Ardenticatenaceae bacterium]|nr:glutamate mutase L [Ardenticatenaceae bacterium]
MTIAEENETQEVKALPSFLIAECGTINTTVALFDVAAGSYRLISQATAPTTATEPWLNIMEGVYSAIRQLEVITGRSLLTPQRKLITPARQNGSGVDQFAAIASAAEPLATLLVGLFDDVSLASARRVLNSTYADAISCLSLSHEQDEEKHLAALLTEKPDLIFIVGGTDGGATQRLLRLVETVSIGMGPLASRQPVQVLYAGNKQLRERVRELLKDRAKVHVAENVRPDLETENLVDATRIINELYSDLKISTLPGIHTLHEWHQQPVIPTLQAFATVAKYFAALHKGRVLGVDLGSNNVAIILADSHKVQTYMRNDLGMGTPLLNLLDEVEPSAIARWMPQPTSDEVIRDFIFYKALNPQTIPVTEMECYLEQAIAREIIRRVVPEPLPSFNVLLARGQTLTNTPRPGQAILLLLDALQPSGIFSVALDKYGVLPALGALAIDQPLAVVQALEAGVLSDLGWVIAPTGKGQAGQSAVKGLVESPQGQFDLDVEHGRIDTTVLNTGQIAEVTLQPDKRINLGFGPGKGKKLSVRGGAVGLVVDARGRPLPTFDDDKRLDQVRKWYWDVGG